ncbi:cellulose biosynthesis cyclic di-GMP-binding regulatory protein BcsB [Photobacterium ganghwense]|uniref:cellulose biosynthesis cyclic di-GMP-binding regulatory protein BcsB n=1 Tax=Photobacterium ganghwense TaxID=320778 RepID=UPI001C2D47FA|nr:cellulose biosynthesis cyclic di-GMP-binding regulatory protein BcsB [Photobacterium ganghwense]MBV1839827.1 cellulose biosynthesis cyclic di-GMP-binding regulatory protein BcsB [Photobacterium ganghwense]
MKRILLFLVCFLITAASQAETIRVPFQYLLPDGRDPMLRGQWDKISFPITVLDHQQANAIQLSLTLSHSGNIELANLWLNLGEKPLANIQLHPSGEPQQIKVTLPPELLSRYGNMMTISVRHQLPASLTMTEQRIDASEAVTEILASQSFYELDYRDTNSSPTLATLAGLIKSGQLHGQTLTIVNLLGDNPQAALTVASHLVQGWTLRSGSDQYQYAYDNLIGSDSGLSSNSSALSDSDKVQLVFGLPENLRHQHAIPDTMTDSIHGPFLAVFRQPETRQWRLIISGRNAAELLQASRYFATPDYILPPQAFTQISEQPLVRPMQMASQDHFRIGMFTQQKQFGDEPLMLPLMMPANMLVNQDENAQINLVLRHPKVDPGEAAMIIRVNGEYANSMPIRASFWRHTQHYRLTFPMRQLRPGLNTVSVELYGPEQRVTYNQGSSYMPFIAQIDSHSTLKLGAWVNYLAEYEHQLPPEQLLFLSANNGRDAQFTLHYEQDSTLSAVWQLLSHLTHQARQPMTDLLLTTTLQQVRPVNLTFDVGRENRGTESSVTDQTGVFNRLRQFLLHTMNADSTGEADSVDAGSVDADNRIQPAAFYQFSQSQPVLSMQGQADSMARLTTDINGWRNIFFSAMDEAALNEEMALYLSQEHPASSGSIELAVHRYQDDLQLARAGFIAYPYMLPLLLLLLILPLALLMHRSLEKTR